MLQGWLTSKLAGSVVSGHTYNQVARLACAHLLGGLLQAVDCLRELGGDTLMRRGQLW
jgi:hypothetical protein